jgi:hypothetical protein
VADSRENVGVSRIGEGCIEFAVFERFDGCREFRLGGLESCEERVPRDRLVARRKRLRARAELPRPLVAKPTLDPDNTADLVSDEHQMADRPGSVVRNTVRLSGQLPIRHVGDLFAKVVERVGKTVKYRLHVPSRINAYPASRMISRAEELYARDQDGVDRVHHAV